MNQLLRGEGIKKSYGIGEENRKVLDHIDIKIEKGEFISVMGPSGSGKSTLLYALSGMDHIDDGLVMFENKRLSDLTENELADLRRKRMGFVFQQPALLKNLNVLDNIILPQMRDNRKDVKNLVKKAKMFMKQMSINGLEQRDITQISGGQLQRVGICRALMNDPEIIFADEPTGALNTKSAKDIMDLLTQINENGTTILLVTHDPGIAARTRRVLFMKDGRMVRELKLAEYKTEEFKKQLDIVTLNMRNLEI